MMAVDCDPDLVQVVCAGNPVCSFPNAPDRRDQKTNEDSNHSDDNDQFHQCKGSLYSAS
jgi:hypothetical protein